MPKKDSPAAPTPEAPFFQNTNVFHEPEEALDNDECYALIGRITAEQSRIEYLLDLIITDLMGVDYATIACLTGQMQSPFGRYNALIQLARHRSLTPELKKKIPTLKEKGNCLAEQRNRVVHDPWLEESRKGASYQSRNKNKQKDEFGPKPVTLKELKDLLGKLRSHHEQVSKLREDIRAERG